jgi:hypothetical protein
VAWVRLPHGAERVQVGLSGGEQGWVDLQLLIGQGGEGLVLIAGALLSLREYYSQKEL